MIFDYMNCVQQVINLDYLTHSDNQLKDHGTEIYYYGQNTPTIYSSTDNVVVIPEFVSRIWMLVSDALKDQATVLFAKERVYSDDVESVIYELTNCHIFD